jgi:hypothetical protein
MLVRSNILARPQPSLLSGSGFSGAVVTGVKRNLRARESAANRMRFPDLSAAIG